MSEELSWYEPDVSLDLKCIDFTGGKTEGAISLLNPSVRQPYAVTYRCLADDTPMRTVSQNFTRYCYSQPHGYLTTF